MQEEKEHYAVAHSSVSDRIKAARIHHSTGSTYADRHKYTYHMNDDSDKWPTLNSCIGENVQPKER